MKVVKLLLGRDISRNKCKESKSCCKNSVRSLSLSLPLCYILVLGLGQNVKGEDVDPDLASPDPVGSGFDLSQVMFDDQELVTMPSEMELDMAMLQAAGLNLNLNLTMDQLAAIMADDDGGDDDDGEEEDDDEPSSGNSTTPGNNRTGKSSGGGGSSSSAGLSAASLLLLSSAVHSARDFRLPSTLVPLSYRLLTRPVIDDMDGFPRLTSPSKIWIVVTVSNETKEIVLHSKNLTINQELTTVTNLNTKAVIPIVNQSFDSVNDFFIISLNESLEVGANYEIFMDFVAPVYNNRRDGIYLTEYKDPANANQTKRLVSTLFAPTQARRAFPCFDEPQLKATFTINVGRTANYSTLSNMPLLGTNPIPNLDGWYSDHYATSIPMSTYLVAFVISNFANHSLIDVVERPVQSWGDVDHVERNGLAYATNLTSALLPYFEDLLGFNFTIPKIDSVAMPKISYAGMESYGLIIYMESSLLYFPGQSTEEQRRRTTALISHELSHQWFGNLVSFSWWSDIYLSEGLSTYIQYYGLEKFNPEFDSWTNFVSDVFQTALTADSNSLTSHPVHQPIERSHEIFLIYDKIAYDKGASLFRMMEHFLTRPVFLQALRKYVNKYAFKAIHQDQLFETFDEVAQEAGVLPANMTIKKIMDTWTLQGGYPLVKVTSVANQSTIIIEQEQYDPEGLALNGTWFIPMTISTESAPSFESTTPTLWLNAGENATVFNATRGDDEWLLINAASTGFYRVIYDTNLTEAIQRQLYLDHTVFPTSARCRMIDDYFSVAFKRYTPVETALNMISYLGKEVDFTVWKTVFSHLKYISEMLSDEDVHLSKWLSTKLENVFMLIDEKSSPEEQENTAGVVALRRHFLITWACYFKVPRCLEYASQLVQKWKETPSVNPIPRAIKASVYCAIAGGEDKELSQFLLERLREETNAEEQNLLIEGLGCARDMNMIQTKLSTMGKILLAPEAAMANVTEEEQKLKMVLKGVIKTSTEGRDISWKFIRSFVMEAAEEKKLSRFSMLGEVVLMLGSYWNTPTEKADLENFINTVSTKLEGNNLSPTLASLLARTLQASVDRVDKNIDWMENFYGRVQSWFALENYYFPEGFLLN